MVFETGSDNERIEELERQFDDIIDSQINSIGGNENLSIDSTLGQRNAAIGDAGGVRSNQPIIHNITDVDTDDVSTGVFDKINLISSMIIVDHTSTPIDLRFIQGPAKNGAKIIITVKKDKVLVIKSGGNILTSSDITITDTEFFILVKHSFAETGITGGAYKILKVGTTGGAGYDTIQEEGVSLTQRTTMNFIGATVTAVDNPGNSRTDITIVAGASGTLSGLTIDTDKNWAGRFITNLGGITMTGDINVNTQDIINIDRSKYVLDSGVVGAATESVILVNSANQFQFNTAQANDIIFSLENIAAVAIDHDGSALTRSLSILSDSTNTNSIAQLNITKNFATSVTGQTIGQLGYLGPSDAGGGLFEYAAIVGEIENATAGAIHGGLRFDLTVNNAVTTFMTMNDGSSEEITVFKNFNFNLNDALNVDRLQFVQNTGSLISVGQPTIYVDGIGNGDLVINNVDTEAIIFTHSNVIGLQTTPAILQKSGVDLNQFIRLVNTFSVPATGVLGAFEISGVNDTPTQLTMAFFAGSIVQISSGGSGSAQIGVAINGVQVDFIRVNDTDDGQTSFLSDINLKANAIILDADGDTTIQAGTDDVMQLVTGSIVQVSIANTSIVITQDAFFGGNLDVNDHYIQFDAITTPADPPATERRLFSDSTNNDELSVRTSSGTTISLEDPGTPDIDGVQDSEIWTNSNPTAQFGFEVYHSNSKQGRDLVSDSFVDLNDNTIHFVPVYVGKAVQLKEIGYHLSIFGTTPGANYTIEMGLYANKTDGTNYPGALVDSDSTTQNTDKGAHTVFQNSTNIQPGLYWIAVIWIPPAPATLSFGIYSIDAAVSVGHFINSGTTPPVFQPIFGYVDPAFRTSLINNAVDDMTPIAGNVPAMFARFEVQP